MTTLLKAPEEPTNGDVMIAIQTLKNAGAEIRSEGGTMMLSITLIDDTNQ